MKQVMKQITGKQITTAALMIDQSPALDAVAALALAIAPIVPPLTRHRLPPLPAHPSILALPRRTISSSRCGPLQAPPPLPPPVLLLPPPPMPPPPLLLLPPPPPATRRGSCRTASRSSPPCPTFEGPWGGSRERWRRRDSSSCISISSNNIIGWVEARARARAWHARVVVAAVVAVLPLLAAALVAAAAAAARRRRSAASRRPRCSSTGRTWRCCWRACGPCYSRYSRCSSSCYSRASAAAAAEVVAGWRWRARVTLGAWRRRRRRRVGGRPPRCGRWSCGGALWAVWCRHWR